MNIIELVLIGFILLVIWLIGKLIGKYQKKRDKAYFDQVLNEQTEWNEPLAKFIRETYPNQEALKKAYWKAIILNYKSIAKHIEIIIQENDAATRSNA